MGYAGRARQAAELMELHRQKKELESKWELTKQVKLQVKLAKRKESHMMLDLTSDVIFWSDKN